MQPSDQAPHTDERLLRLASYLSSQGAAGRIGIGSLLAEVERKYPGEIARMTAGMELRRLGVPYA
jgi:hypothetical protein